MPRLIDPAQIVLRPFHVLDEEWALLATGTSPPNLMTVSWGGLGTLWERPMVTVYVRPVRHSYRCLETHAEYTLNFLPHDEFQTALDFCGSASGRDVDKWEETGLTAVASSRVAVPRVVEAALTLECRVVSTFDLDPARFKDPAIDALYPDRDYHRAYLGEVLAAWADERFVSGRTP